MKFSRTFFYVLALFFTIASFPLPGVESACYPDTKQNCDPKSELEKQSWNTTMRFMLYTRKNYKVPELLHMCYGTLPKKSSFNPDNRLAVFIPGFAFGACDLYDFEEIKDELLDKEDLNFILIDDTYEYGVDFVNAKKVQKILAKIIVKVLKNIQEETGIKNDQIYLMGFSIGCQVAGVVGSLFKVKRITAMDPAGVQYDKDTPIEDRLDPSDADLVDVIHCNGGNGIPYFGINFPSGHVDFYVNGGSDQPSCGFGAWQNMKNYQIIYAIGIITLPTLCSHDQCLKYFKLSINNRHGNFTAWKCDNYDSFKAENCTGSDATPVIMGFDFDKYADNELKDGVFPTKYFVDTSDTYPYVTNNGTYREKH